MIREGCPAEPEPPLKNYPPRPWTEYKESLAIEAGFRKFIRRAKPESKDKNEISVIVCHGNVIRYFLCRGLQLPPTAWLHMSLAHCSVSSLHCRPSGTVGTRGIGEAAFLPKNLITFVNEVKQYIRTIETCFSQNGSSRSLKFRCLFVQSRRINRYRVNRYKILNRYAFW